MADVDIKAAIKQLQEGIDRMFPKAQGPEVEKLRERVLALQAGMEQQDASLPSGQFTPFGQMRVYAQLRELLLLYREVIVPILAEMEKQRLDSVVHMARFLESSR